MTCGECLESLATSDLKSLSSGRRDPETEVAVADLSAHLAGCPACARALELMIAGERALSESLDAEFPARPWTSVAEIAWARVHRARLRRWIVGGFIVLVFVAGSLLIRSVIPDMQRLLAPPPPVVTVTYSLTCLSSEQAATLLRPYLPMPENPRWQAERFSVMPAGYGIRAVTVRAPQELIDRVPGMLARFERDPGAECRR